MAASTLRVLGSVTEMSEEKFDKEKDVKTSQSSNILVWLKHGHGDYVELQHERHFFYASCRSSLFVCHFYTIPSEDCEIMDYHLKQLATKHLETKFCRLDIVNAPFFKKRLSIKVLPFLVMVRRKKIKDYISGFSQLGNRNDFSTDYLEWRLAKSNMIRYDGNRAVPPKLRTDSPKLLRFGNVVELQKCKKSKSRESIAYERRRKAAVALTSAVTSSLLVRYRGASSVRLVNEKRNLIDDEDCGVRLARGTTLSPVEQKSLTKYTEASNKKQSVDVIWVSTKPVTSKTSLSSNKSKMSKTTAIGTKLTKQNQNNLKITNEKLTENLKNVPKLLRNDPIENAGIEEASAALIKLQQEKLQLRKSFMPMLNGRISLQLQPELQNDIDKISKNNLKISSDKNVKNNKKKEHGDSVSENVNKNKLMGKKKIPETKETKEIKEKKFEVSKVDSFEAIDGIFSNSLQKNVKDKTTKITSNYKNLSALDALHKINKYPDSRIVNCQSSVSKMKTASKRYSVYNLQDENNNDEKQEKIIDSLSFANIQNMTVGTIIKLSPGKINNFNRKHLH